jgi:hypothetical protein
MAKRLEASEPPASATHEGLTDDQRRALFYFHIQKYEVALAKKKAADADFKNACKLSRSEMGADAITRFKLAIQLRTEEGIEEVKAQMHSEMEVARWVNARLGMQLELFEEGNERELAFEDGKVAGLAGSPRKPPAELAKDEAQSWLKGYGEGQKVLAKGFRKPLELSAKPGSKPKRGSKKATNGNGHAVKAKAKKPRGKKQPTPEAESEATDTALH